MGPGRDAFAEIAASRKSMAEEVGSPMDLPAPDVVLDLASRRGDSRRLATHIHQMCVLHQANYAQGIKIKHISLVDAFLQLANTGNAVALYAVARSMFEMSALTHEVKSRLAETVRHSTDSNWMPMGEKFFGVIVRARFATTNPDHRQLLLEQGISPNRLKPFNVMNCISGLAEESGQLDAVQRYEILCDFVHHNLGSSTVANSGIGVADAARSAAGGMMITDGPMPIVRYEYPVQGQLQRSLDHIAPGFLRDATACITWMDATPESPFSSELLSLLVGHPLGFQVLRQPHGSQ